MLSAALGLFWGSVIMAAFLYWLDTRWLRRDLKELNGIVEFFYAHPDHAARDSIDMDNVYRRVIYCNEEIAKIMQEKIQSCFWYVYLVWYPIVFVREEITNLINHVKRHHPHAHLDLDLIREEEGRF